MNVNSNISNLTVKVYYEDTDAAGIVYHSKYLNYAERGRSEFLNKIGFLQSKLYAEKHIRFVVKNLKVNYKGYASLDDSLRITTSVKLINKAKIVFLQKIFKEDKIINIMEVVVCCINNIGKVARIPNELYYKIIN